MRARTPAIPRSDTAPRFPGVMCHWLADRGQESAHGLRGSDSNLPCLSYHANESAGDSTLTPVLTFGGFPQPQTPLPSSAPQASARTETAHQEAGSAYLFSTAA